MKKISIKHFLNTRLKAEKDGKTLVYPIYISVTYDRMNVRIPSNINNGSDFIITESNIDSKKIDKKMRFKLDYEKDLIMRCVEIFKKDDEQNNLNKNLTQFYSIKKYKSKNERLNILNSYIDFYTHSIYTPVTNNIKDKIKSAVLNKIAPNIENFDLLDSTKIQLLLYPNNPNLYKIIKNNDLGYEYEKLYFLYSRFHSFLADQGRNYNYDMPFIDWRQNKGQQIFLNFLKSYTRKTDPDQFKIFSDKDFESCIQIIENIINKENYFDIAKK